MSDPAEMDRDRSMLAELAELGMALARNLQARALAAEDPKTANDLGAGFHRVSRSVRQTLALKAKLERDRQSADREARAEAVRDREARVYTRKAQVRAAVERAIWTEAEAGEAERLVDDLDDLLDEQTLYDGFVESPLDSHIARLRSDLGLSPTAGGDGSSSHADPAHRQSSG